MGFMEYNGNLLREKLQYCDGFGNSQIVSLIKYFTCVCFERPMENVLKIKELFCVLSFTKFLLTSLKY